MLNESKTRKLIAISLIVACVSSAIAVSLIHFEMIFAHVIFLIYTVLPYPLLWFLSTRTKRMSTRLFWCAYSGFSFLAAMLVYVLGPLTIIRWAIVAVVFEPACIIAASGVAFAVFALVRRVRNPPNQSPQPIRAFGPLG